MKNIIILAALIIILGIGGYLVSRQGDDAVVESVDSNLVVEDSTTELEIMTEDQVGYYPDSLGFYAAPAVSGSYPGVVMIHENRGLRPEIKTAAEDLARRGYRVLAVDLYKGNVMESQEEARAYSSKFNQEEGTANLEAAVQYLKDKGASKIASLGWCFGGRQSVALAISGTPLDATVVYYGGGMATSTERLAPINWPVLGVFGDQDQVIPVAMVNDFETSLNTLGIENEIYIYEGVGHAFANPSNPNFAPDATADAWQKTLTFLESHLK